MTLVPSERVMGCVLVRVVGDLFGTKRISVFDFFVSVPVCICRPNFLRCSSARLAVLVASSREGRINVLSSTYRDIQWMNSVPFDFGFCPVILPHG